MQFEILVFQSQFSFFQVNETFASDLAPYNMARITSHEQKETLSIITMYFNDLQTNNNPSKSKTEICTCNVHVHVTCKQFSLYSTTCLQQKYIAWS